MPRYTSSLSRNLASEFRRHFIRPDALRRNDDISRDITGHGRPFREFTSNSAIISHIVPRIIFILFRYVRNGRLINGGVWKKD